MHNAAEATNQRLRRWRRRATDGAGIEQARLTEVARPRFDQQPLIRPYAFAASTSNSANPPLNRKSPVCVSAIATS